MAENAGFRLLLSNSVIELYENTMLQRGEPFLVISSLGNGATFGKSVLKWRQSPAYAANFVLCVKTAKDVQAVYRKAESDDPDASSRDWTGHEKEHTALVLQGVSEKIQEHAEEKLPWVLHGASGGCVTAVVLARDLAENGTAPVLSVIADAGVPGDGLALPQSVPVCVFAFRSKREYWSGGRVAEVWRDYNHNVEFEFDYTWGGHAGGVTSKRLRECLEWLRERYGM